MAALPRTGIVQMQRNPHIVLNSAEAIQRTAPTETKVDVMAQAAITNVAGAGNGFGGIVDAIKAGLQRRALYRQTVAELNALSGRELEDLGISRQSIRQTAFEAAYGK